MNCVGHGDDRCFVGKRGFAKAERHMYPAEPAWGDTPVPKEISAFGKRGRSGVDQTGIQKQACVKARKTVAFEPGSFGFHRAEIGVGYDRHSDWKVDGVCRGRARKREAAVDLVSPQRHTLFLKSQLDLAFAKRDAFVSIEFLVGWESSPKARMAVLESDIAQSQWGLVAFARPQLEGEFFANARFVRHRVWRVPDQPHPSASHSDYLARRRFQALDHAGIFYREPKLLVARVDAHQRPRRRRFGNR